MRKDKFVKYHVKQGIVLLITSIIVVVVLNIISWILAFAGLGLFLLVVMNIISLAILVLVILGTINAAKGEMKELPAIGHYADKINM